MRIAHFILTTLIFFFYDVSAYTVVSNNPCYGLISCFDEDKNTVNISLFRYILNPNHYPTISSVETIPYGISNFEIDFGDNTILYITPSSLVAQNGEFFIDNGSANVSHTYNAIGNYYIKFKINFITNSNITVSKYISPTHCQPLVNGLLYGQFLSKVMNCQTSTNNPNISSDISCEITQNEHVVTPSTCNNFNGKVSLNLSGIYEREYCNSIANDNLLCYNTTYTWSNGNNTKDILDVQSGFYSVTVRNNISLKKLDSPEILDSKSCDLIIDFVVSDVCEEACDNCISSFSPIRNQKYILSAWVKENEVQGSLVKNYEYAQIEILFPGSTTTTAGSFKAKGKIIEGWQKIEEEFTIPPDATEITVRLINTNPSVNAYYDDIRVHPFNSSFKSFVYDPVTLRLMAELDDRNYATKYEYDLEGKLIRVKKETERGIETIKESRNNSFKSTTP